MLGTSGSELTSIRLRTPHMLTGRGCLSTIGLPVEGIGVTFSWRTVPTLWVESTSLVPGSLAGIPLVVKKTQMHNNEKLGAKRVPLQGLVLPPHGHSLFPVCTSPPTPSLPSLPLSRAGVFGFNFRFLHLCDLGQATYPLCASGSHP